MLERWRLGRMKRRLRASLEADRLQPDGWRAWLDGASTAAALDACPEPGWLLHLTYWSGTSAAAMLRGVLDALDRAAAPALRALLTEGERRRLRGAVEDAGTGRFGDKAELVAVYARFEDALAGALSGAGAQAAARVSLAEALLVDAARLRATELPAGRDGPADARASLALLALAALHVEDGRREWAAQCLAESGALLARALPARRDELLEAMRSALRDPVTLPPARVVRGGDGEGPGPSEGERA